MKTISIMSFFLDFGYKVNLREGPNMKVLRARVKVSKLYILYNKFFKRFYKGKDIKIL